MTSLDLGDVRCTYCDAPVGSDFDEAAAVVRCACGKVLDLAPFIVEQRMQRNAAAGEPLVPRPAGLATAGTATYQIGPGPNPGGWAGPFVMLFLAAVAFGWWMAAETWLPRLVGLLLLAPVVAVIGTQLWGYRVLRVVGTVARVSWRPMPWFGTKVDLSSVRELTVEQGTEASTRYRWEPTWSLVAKTRSGEVRLVERLSDPMAATYLKQELERHLRRLRGKPR